MKPLFVKEISTLTNVSVRTLHYYDKIGLLKASHRLPNGYRVYTEKDLLKLEKIIALKFFGFTLARIKHFLVDENQTLEQLENQLFLLRSEVSFLQEAQRELLAILIADYKKNAKIDWHRVVKRITECTTTSKELKLYTSMLATAHSKKQPETTSSEDYQALWKKIISKLSPTESNDSR